MARAPRNTEAAELPIGPVTETITYIPGEGDPAVVVRNGHAFHANVPKEITGNPEGTKHERINMQIIESCRNNKYYVVGDNPTSSRRKASSSQPETAEEYRAYMVEWLKGRFDHAQDLVARFARDRDLQIVCEVGVDDYAYLSSLFMPKLHELARGDELTEQQVAALWLQHGINQLPW